ncbi:MAG: HRDC domain-containing protein [Verrucomicrobiales bacterium]
MPYAHFSIPAHGGEPEERLNRFLSGHRIIRVERQFVAAGSDSFWAYQVEYGEASNSGAAAKVGGGRKMVDYKEELNENDFSFFLELKNWRKTRAEEEGVDAFNVFTNAQLAAIAEKRPTSLSALTDLPGIGSGRADKYGETVLKLVADAS